MYELSYNIMLPTIHKYFNTTIINQIKLNNQIFYGRQIFVCKKLKYNISVI